MARVSNNYRGDIDGLRALAVVPVILFHAGALGVKGGFIGVDIFFVISGFLITGIIYGEVGPGTFSLWNFYERRIRRIFPALFVMLAASSLAASALLLPEQLKAFGDSLTAAVLSVSNIYFRNETGYFNTAAVTKPLLHTWSLGVEEQFYIFFPLGLMLLRRLDRRWVLAVVGAAAAMSFGISLWGVRAEPAGAFYLLHFRAWELLTGALVSLAAPYLPKSPRLAGAASAIGLALIVLPIVLYNSNTQFPGELALPPVFGAALLIFAGLEGRPTVNRLLAVRPMVAIGKASYSLYLWHWPIFVFARHYLIVPPSAPQMSVLLIATLAVGFASHRYIEQPFRHRSDVRAQRRAFAAAGLAALCGLAFGAILDRTQGLPGRVDPRVVQLLADAKRDPTLLPCLETEWQPVNQYRYCETRPGAEPSFILWGDSHAHALAPEFRAVALESGRQGVFAMYTGCPPVLGIRRLDRPRADCPAFNARVVDYIHGHPSIRNVVLAARWPLYVEGRRNGTERETLALLADGAGRARIPAENAPLLRRHLALTLAELSSRRVSIIDSAPEIGITVPEALARLTTLNRDLELRPRVEAYRERHAGTAAVFSEISALKLATVYPVERVYCGVERCEIERNGASFYSDDDHLSPLGAHQISAIIRQAIQAPPVQP